MTAKEAEKKVEEEAQALEAAEEIEKVEDAKKPDLTIGFKEVLEKAEGLSRALGEALQNRVNVVMVRVNDETLSYLDMLVEAGVCKSRSESAAFLINAGVNSSKELFGKIEDVTSQIADLRAQLREMVGVPEQS
jgi:hypothetical protein